MKRRLYVRYLECVISETFIVPVLESVSRKRLVETVTDLMILVSVCEWSVRCSHELWMCKWSINRVINPNPVYSHSHPWQYEDAHILALLLPSPTQIFSQPGPRIVCARRTKVLTNAAVGSTCSLRAVWFPTTTAQRGPMKPQQDDHIGGLRPSLR
jgi:hypothetical protein